MSEFEQIPPTAFAGIGDPQPNLYATCWTCGGSNVRCLSMGEMMMVPRARMVNEHTFIQPNVAWGYLQCDECEDRQQRKSLAPKTWWQRLLRLGDRTNESPDAT